MFCFTKPSPEAVREFRSAQRDQQFAYEHVGASRTEAPKGYVVDHNRIQLGEGRAAFARAKNAIQQWKMFAIPWIELFWPDTLIEEGATVAVAASHLDSGPCTLPASFIRLTNAARWNATDLLTALCPTTRRWAKNASPLNFIPTTTPFGTTSTLSLGRTLGRAWHTHTHVRYRKSSRPLRKRRCRQQCDRPERTHGLRER